MKFLVISLNDSSKFLTMLTSHPFSLGTLKLRKKKFPTSCPSILLRYPPACCLLLSSSRGYIKVHSFQGALTPLSSGSLGALLPLSPLLQSKPHLIPPSSYTMKLNKGLLVFTKYNQYFLY